VPRHDVVAAPPARVGPEHAMQDRFVYYNCWRVGDVLRPDEQASMGTGDHCLKEHRIALYTIVIHAESP
jgi:hypothetical protein